MSWWRSQPDGKDPSSKLTVACKMHVCGHVSTITVGVVLIVFDWIDSFFFSMANFSGMNMQPHYGSGGVSPQRCGFISCNLWRSMFVVVSLHVERVMTLVCAIRSECVSEKCKVQDGVWVFDAEEH